MLRTPLTANEVLSTARQALGYLFGITAMPAALGRFVAGLFSSEAFAASATLDLTPNGAGVSYPKTDLLGGGVLCSQNALDLVSYFSVEAFVHWATSTCG